MRIDCRIKAGMLDQLSTHTHAYTRARSQSVLSIYMRARLDAGRCVSLPASAPPDWQFDLEAPLSTGILILAPLEIELLVLI